ncbi:MAG: pseudouridine synthase [Planctomycetes bacterium]|nr:pseudouridine synthase [Planctomycetota bacterium]
MSSYTNIAAYRFAVLADLKPLRERLLTLCREKHLKGTILLSTEGVNLFIAGLRSGVDFLLSELRSIPGLEGLTAKYSESANQPFSRMLVKIKKEIISFGVEGIDPASHPAPKLSPNELKQWLDEGRPVTLLDTRNDYEVKLGTFHGAMTLGIDHFRQFPDAVRDFPDEMKQQPIVMFCTGGIRCEKAGPFMEREGFEKIFQLDGGILKYFEECGTSHYDGECFVFDQRVGIDASLKETSSSQCFACLTPLRSSEIADPRYIPGQSCPYCFVDSETRMAEQIELRQQRIANITACLPGSQPYNNYRPLRIPFEFHERTLIDSLRSIFPHVPPSEWDLRFSQDRILDAENHPVQPNHIVRSGEQYLQSHPGTIEPAVNPEIRILYEDESIIAIHKPAPLPMHPCGRFNRNTLQYILNEVYSPHHPRAAHRLDANTSGVVLLTRTRHQAGILQPQFERGQVEKMYLARVLGHPESDFFECTAPISTVSGELGSRSIDEANGLPSQTDFHVLERFEDGTSLLEVVPKTGRTNQIRVHLWWLGWPIVGDSAYLPNREIGKTQTLDVDESPLCLLAWKITFNHPTLKKRMTIETQFPSWIQSEMKRTTCES